MIKKNVNSSPLAPEIFVSIVVCTYNRYEYLARCIDNILNNCPIDGVKAELLVVDNTPISLRKPIDMADGPGRRALCTDIVGLANARNEAITSSKSDVIAFIDDDAFVLPGWFNALVSTFERIPNAYAVGGRCNAQYETETLPPWFDKKLNGYLSCIDWGDHERFISAAEWVVGANVAFRRSVFQTYGLFDTSLGRKGDASLLSNEETALMDKIGREHVYYQPAALVDHVVPASRLSLEWFRKRVFWQAISDLVSGSVWIPKNLIADQYREVVARSRAEHRNITSFYYEPKSYSEFDLQLKSIYLATVLGAEGYNGLRV